MNRITLIGNLTHAPEVSKTSNGTTVSRFSIAVTRRYQNANGERETDFFPVTAFGKLAENCNLYLDKGRKVAVCGSLQIHRYTDKDGIQRQAFDVIADEVEFLSAKTDDTQTEMPQKPSKQVEMEDVTDNDNLPF